MANSTGVLSPAQNATRLRAIRDRVRRITAGHRPLTHDQLRGLAYVDRLACKDLGEEDWRD